MTSKVHWIKEVKDVNSENNVTLMKEIEDNANKWKGILCSWVEALILFKWPYYPGRVRIQCNPYQNTKGIFIFYRTDILIAVLCHSLCLKFFSVWNTASFFLKIPDGQEIWLFFFISYKYNFGIYWFHAMMEIFK